MSHAAEILLQLLGVSAIVILYLNCLGNAVVPQQARVAFKRLCGLE